MSPVDLIVFCFLPKQMVDSNFYLQWRSDSNSNSSKVETMGTFVCWGMKSNSVYLCKTLFCSPSKHSVNNLKQFHFCSHSYCLSSSVSKIHVCWFYDRVICCWNCFILWHSFFKNVTLSRNLVNKRNNSTKHIHINIHTCKSTVYAHHR